MVRGRCELARNAAWAHSASFSSASSLCKTKDSGPSSTRVSLALATSTIGQLHSEQGCSILIETRDQQSGIPEADGGFGIQRSVCAEDNTIVRASRFRGDHAVAYIAGNVFRVTLRRITKPCPAGKFHHKAVVRRNCLFALGVELLSGR
jgi:hypothetical protein